MGVNVHYIPVHTQPYYEKMRFKSVDFPAARHYYGEIMSLAMFQTMTELQQDRVVFALEGALR